MPGEEPVVAGEFGSPAAASSLSDSPRLPVANLTGQNMAGPEPTDPITRVDGEDELPIIGAIRVSSSSGLPVRFLVLQEGESVSRVQLGEAGRFPIDRWTAGVQIRAAGHLPVVLGEAPTDIVLKPSHLLRFSRVDFDGELDMPVLEFQSEWMNKQKDVYYDAGRVGEDWVMVTSGLDPDYGEAARVQFPGLMELWLDYSPTPGVQGTLDWSMLRGRNPRCLPLPCELVGAPSEADSLDIAWQFFVFTTAEEVDRLYQVANGDWGNLQFATPSRKPAAGQIGLQSEFKDIPHGMKFGVLATVPGIGFGWSGPAVQDGSTVQLEYRELPKVRMELIDGVSGRPIPAGTKVKGNWHMGRTRKELSRNPMETTVGTGGAVEWQVPIAGRDFWSNPEAPYPSKGIQVRVSVAGYEPMQFNETFDDFGVADFGRVELEHGQWGLTIDSPVAQMNKYSELYFGSARIPSSGGALEALGRLPISFGGPEPQGEGMSSIWIEDGVIDLEVRSVFRCQPEGAAELHFFRLESDGNYRRVAFQTTYVLELSSSFLSEYPGWYRDVVYFAPAFSLGNEIGYLEMDAESIFREFLGPDRDLFLKLTSPIQGNAPAQFFPLKPGTNMFE